MNIETESLSTKYPYGDLLTEGKTKKIYRVKNNAASGIFDSKDVITAGDGARHDIIPDKGILATTTTCNVFRLLQECGLPVAFEAQIGPTSFVASICDMLPYEVVVRREAHGSYLKGNPHLLKGQLFPKLVVQFFLKTSGKKWGSHKLVCDDPLMSYTPGSGRIQLLDPTKPIHGQEPFLVLDEGDVFQAEGEHNLFPKMSSMARNTFLILEKAWQIESRRLVDFKIEFGIDLDGNLLLADVIDNDSWRVIEDGLYIDKQSYRDGAALDDVALNYRRVAEATSRFYLPRQRIILWGGSIKDDMSVMTDLIKRHFPNDDDDSVVCSGHKEPERALAELRRLVQEVPDSVVIAFVGMSDGLGPTLAANITIPVIAVPASVGAFPDDVWSSLRCPSQVPLMTVLSQKNAVLAAANILSARNPRLYAFLRTEIENRTMNTIPLQNEETDTVRY